MSKWMMSVLWQHYGNCVLYWVMVPQYQQIYWPLDTTVSQMSTVQSMELKQHSFAWNWRRN